ncbi:unnamed protein product, partial [Adineta steineri]
MIVFSFMTISNVRHSQNRIYHSTAHVLAVSESKSIKRSNKADHHLLLILFVQVILLGVLTIPLSIEKLHSTFKFEEVRSDFRVAIENMLYNFVLLLTYLANGIPFYVYTLSSGTVFRKAFFDLI